MVSVHDIPLDQYNSGSVGGAVAISLAARSKRDRVHRFQAEGWEVELRRGCNHVVARTIQPLAGNRLIDAAIDYTHRALDLTSVEDGDHLVTTAPADEYIVFELEDGRRFVRFQCVKDFLIGIDVTATAIQTDGTVKPQPIRPPLAWVPAFRFHRLSQGSRDLFDAYRNMFLGLEALLDQLFPKGRREREKAWLQRSVASAGERIDLARLATPGASDPVQDLVDRLYGVRLNLFHAKTGQLLIPDERLSYITVAESYPVLLALWMEIVRGWLPLRRGGGAVTYQGFRMMTENAYASARIGVTADDTPPDKDETTSSPRGLLVSVFAQPARITEVRPGRMGLHGRIDVSALPGRQVVGRVLTLKADGTPLIISPIPGGLMLDGADVFETTQVMRLVNRDQPRTEFS